LVFIFYYVLYSLAKQLVPKITQFFSAVSVTVSNHQADLESQNKVILQLKYGYNWYW